MTSGLLITIVMSVFLFQAECKEGFIKISEQDYYQGDIIWTPTSRNAILKTRKWTNGIIPYVITNEFTQDELNMITNAMREIEQYSCIRFVKRTTEKNYAKIFNGDGCAASAGMKGGEQIISLRNVQGTSCFQRNTVLHEFLHCIGLEHEHNRVDRDEYVNVRYDKIRPTEGARFQFQKVQANETSTYNIPYTYASIMHYDAWANGDNHAITMEPKQPGWLHIMGFAEYVHENDWLKIRRIYDCPNNYYPQPTTPAPCQDQHNDCIGNLRLCDKQNWMVKSCRKTCGYCTQGGIPTKPQPECKDELTYCKEQLDKCGKERWMTGSCRKSCGFCDYSMCMDSLTYCDLYENECKTADWMKTSCRRTCGYC